MNNEQSQLACGYIPKSDRQDKFYEFELYNDPNFGVDICPVWYYNEFNYLYETYNLIKNSSINLIEQPFMIRYIFTIFNDVIELQIKKNNDDWKRKNKK